MARDRKRAKQRRDRRAQAPGGAPARAHADEVAAPAPLEHASAEAEVAEAQVALGRPELAEAVTDEAELEREAIAAGAPAAPDLAEDEGSGRAVSAEPVGLTTDAGARHPSQRQPAEGSRLMNFFRGSWRELQRVQWPDRRQVAQATGVVIGFVVVAGAFLGFADFVAGKLVDVLIK
jgi:preprotein translocase SecE subunit